MPKTTSVTFAFTARRLEMSLSVLNDGIEYMKKKKAAASNPDEIAFYDGQTPKFEAVCDLLRKTLQTVGKGGTTRKVRLTAEQYHMLLGSLGKRNLDEALAINALLQGSERDERQAANNEWMQFREDFEAKDPRKYDTSQDAEDEDDEEDGSEE